MEMINANNHNNVIHVKPSKEESKEYALNKYRKVDIHPEPKNERHEK